MREWKMGDPLDPENRVGALVSKTHFDKVKSYLERAEQKLSVAHGGETRAGHLRRADGRRRRDADRSAVPGGDLRPGAVGHDLRDRWRSRSRSPTTRIYGLAASVYTGSLRNAIRLAREIRAGMVTVNCFGEGDATTPFGGYKESGFGGRDKSIFAHDQYTELKTIWIDAA